MPLTVGLFQSSCFKFEVGVYTLPGDGIKFNLPVHGADPGLKAP